MRAPLCYRFCHEHAPVPALVDPWLDPVGYGLRHGAERVSEGLPVQMGGQALDQAMNTNSGVTKGIIMGAYGIGTTIGVMLPHSRGHELVADHLGLLYMARTGYNPYNAVNFWKRFSEDKTGNNAEWLSTHPLDKTRIGAIESHLPQTLAEYQKAHAR